MAILSLVAALVEQIQTTGFNGLWTSSLQTLIRVSYLIKTFGRSLCTAIGYWHQDCSKSDVPMTTTESRSVKTSGQTRIQPCVPRHHL